VDSFGLAYVGLSIGMWSSENLLPTRYLEFIPIVLGICIWSHQLQSKKLIMHIDHLAFVHINKQTSRNPRVLSLLRHSILVSLLYNIQIKAIHVGGKKNQVAEAISHWQWNRFRYLDPAAHYYPCQSLPIILDVSLIFLTTMATYNWSDHKFCITFVWN
jgi:hypothetical protein